MPSPSQTTERSKPLLGTFVSMRVQGLTSEHANKAMSLAFGEVAAIHALMSFHEFDSDVSHLNREAHYHDVQVDARTYEVLKRAEEISTRSAGVFDISVAAPRLVATEALPMPLDAPAPDKSATWRDICLRADNRVRFSRPLWIDLGGIAKGFAVDRAIDILSSFAPIQASVNAGGDMRVWGPEPELVTLQLEGHDPANVPTFELRDAALASSGGLSIDPVTNRCRSGLHINGATQHRVNSRRFVAVAAPTCIVADALTKVLMAGNEASQQVLEHYRANAVTHEPDRGWVTIA